MKGILIVVLAVVLPALAVNADDQQAQDEAAEGLIWPHLGAPSKPPCALGFCMGQTIEDEPDDNDIEGVLYNQYDHRAFNKGVAVYWTEATGVCRLKGIHKIFGTPVRQYHQDSSYTRFVDLVTRKYGEPDSTTDRPDYERPRHLRSLRYLASVWAKSLPEGTLRIEVKAEASFILVTYEFPNNNECRKVGRSSIGDDF